MLPVDSQERIAYLAESILFDAEGNLEAVPKALYEWERPYRFEERILKGDFCPYPSKDFFGTNCFDDAMMKFFIADHLGLEPEFMMLWGYKKKDKPAIGDGKTLDSRISRIVIPDTTLTNHAANTMRWKNSRILVDTYYSHFGLCWIFDDHNEMLIREGDLRPWTRMGFEQRLPFTKEDLLEKMHYMQTDPEGIIRNIEGGHRVKRYFINNFREDMMFYYDRNVNSIVVQLQAYMPHISNMAFENHLILDNEGNIAREQLNLSAYSDADWIHLNGKVDFGTYDMSLIEQCWKKLVSQNLFSGDYSRLAKTNFFDVDSEVITPDITRAARSELEKNLSDDNFRYRFVKMFIPQHLYNTLGTDYSDIQRLGIINELREHIYQKAPELTAVALVENELNFKFRMPGERHSKRNIRKKYKEMGKEYNSIGDRHNAYLNLYTMGQRLFHRVRDFEMFVGDNMEFISKMEKDFLRSEDRFITMYKDEMLEVFTYKLSQLLIRAFQTRENLGFKKYFGKIQPKIRDYLHP